MPCASCHIFSFYRVIYTTELDRLTLEILEEIDSGRGFDKTHIFHKPIQSGIASICRTEWQLDVVEFAKSVEAHGGEKVCNLLRGPGKGATQYANSSPWCSINTPFPPKHLDNVEKQHLSKTMEC